MENLIIWSRYLCRTSKLQKIANEEMDNDSLIRGIFPNEMLLTFYAFLYVTIEAFRKCALRDKRVHYLIGSRYTEHYQLLKELRNSIFHPDESICSQRQKNILSESERIMSWTWALMDEFERFYYFYPESIGLYGSNADQIREELRSINAWFPNSSLAIVKHESKMDIARYKEYVHQNFPDKILEFNALCSEADDELIRLPDTFFPELNEYGTISPNETV